MRSLSTCDRRQWDKALSVLPTLNRALKIIQRDRPTPSKIGNGTRHRYKHAEIFRRVVYGYEPCSKVAKNYGCSATTVTCRVKEMAANKGCPQDWLFIGGIREWFAHKEKPRLRG